jgi:hypothetical protein
MAASSCHDHRNSPDAADEADVDRGCNDRAAAAGDQRGIVSIIATAIGLSDLLPWND